MKFHIIESNDKKTLQGNIRKVVERDSFIMTDELKGYIRLDKDYNHLTVKNIQPVNTFSPIPVLQQTTLKVSGL